jgi:hypothetical protein
MAFGMRVCVSLILFLGFVPIARGSEGDGPTNQSKLAEARRALGSMRENYAYVLRKEEGAKSDSDPVLLNTLHQISVRIRDLIGVADTSLDDMRVAISSNEAAEAVDASLEKIFLLKTKSDQARREADRSLGIKLIHSEGDDGTVRSLVSDSDALVLSDDPPLPSATGENGSLPPSPLPPPPASAFH